MPKEIKRAPFREFDFHMMRRGLKPYNIERGSIEPDLKAGLGRIALSVFTDCSNAGIPFQEALLAVYLTGLENGSSIVRERFSNKGSEP